MPHVRLTLPSRLIAADHTTLGANLASRLRHSRVIRVSTNPGATAFTLMLNGPSSIASVRAIPCSPALAAE